MPPKKLRVAAYTPFTGKGAGYPNVVANGNKLLNALALAKTEIEKLKDPDGTLVVFVAPEWAWKKDKGFWSYGELGQILEFLITLSKAHPKWLIFPGTILWAITSKEETGNEKKFNWSKFKFEVAHFYTDKYVVYNTMPVLLNGTFVHFAHKQYEGLDVKTKDPNQVFAFDPGKDASTFWKGFKAKIKSIDTDGKDVKPVLANTFQHDGLKFGVEICRDHFEKVLKGVATDCDVQVLLSCGAMFTQPGMAAKQDGIAIGCDGNTTDPDNKAAALMVFKVPPDKKPPKYSDTVAKKSLFGGGLDSRVAIWKDLVDV